MFSAMAPFIYQNLDTFVVTLSNSHYNLIFPVLTSNQKDIFGRGGIPETPQKYFLYKMLKTIHEDSILQIFLELGSVGGLGSA